MQSRLGLATEFMTKKEAKSRYGKKGPSSVDDIHQDFHRSRWTKGDWTDDTDQMLLIMLGIIEKDGQVLETDFANRLVKWIQEGFPELGDHGGCGVGRTVLTTVITKGFREHPHEIAKKTWEDSDCYLAANGAVMRTSILGVLNFNNISKVIENTKCICYATHADPRCLASCVAVTTAIAYMLQGRFSPEKPDDLKELITESCKHGLECLLENKEATNEMKKYVSAKSWKDLQLGGKKSIGYTFKALGAGFYGLAHCNDYWKSIIELIMEAGDADTNAAVCGALLGCKLGYTGLPAEHLEKMPHKKWLDKHVEKFLATIGLEDQAT
ncbi:ADP-ribosylarginine hydrolase Tri1-like isoform X1 [Oscarella lobularis]|uniref:ADP-ribosylarginine hydrolase Tri1-like isoform X1 n=1 Tax=Oscarella lobularis TaxID=121494 RepID=UPI00331436CA